MKKKKALITFSAATYEEVVKVGGIRVASSLLAEENMHYTYTGAMLLANLAAKEEAIPQLIEARAYAPLMDWLVRTQDSKVPQFETKRHVIRALRSLYVSVMPLLWAGGI